MQGFNSVNFLGTITRDLESKFVGENQVVRFTVVANEKYNDKEFATFLDCEMWGKRTETLVKFFKKGDPILVSGSLRQENWEKDGQKRSKLLLRVNDFAFTGNAQSSDDSSNKQQSKAPAGKKPANNSPKNNDTNLVQDEIPF